MDGLIQDIRYGIRQLFRQRGSSFVAVLTLALAIGVSTALFSVIDATMLRPLPYPNPELLVSVGVDEVQPDGRISRPTPSMEDCARGRPLRTSSPRWQVTARSGRIATAPSHSGSVSHFTETIWRAASRHSSAAVSRARTGSGRRSSRSSGTATGRAASRTHPASSARRSVSMRTSRRSSACCRGSTDHAVAAPLRIPLNEFSRRHRPRLRLRPPPRWARRSEQARRQRCDLVSTDAARQVALVSRLATSRRKHDRQRRNGAVALILLISRTWRLAAGARAARQSELAIAPLSRTGAPIGNSSPKASFCCRQPRSACSLPAS